MTAKPNRKPDFGFHNNRDDEEDDNSKPRLANRALRPGESVYQPPDGSPAIILRPGESPPVPPTRPVSSPPPIYDGQPWTPPVQSWDVAIAAGIRCAVAGCTNKHATWSHST